MKDRTEADGKLVHFDPAMNFAEEDDEDYQLCLNGGTVAGTNRILNAYTANFGPEHARKLVFWCLCGTVNGD